MLAQPFPGHGPDPDDVDALLAVRPQEEDFEDFDDAIEAWDERWKPLMFASARTAGAIVISHVGCAQRKWLIISGTHRGTIWSDCRADDGDLAPLLDQAGNPVTFTHWDIDWLQKAELTGHQPSLKACRWTLPYAGTAPSTR